MGAGESSGPPLTGRVEDVDVPEPASSALTTATATPALSWDGSQVVPACWSPHLPSCEHVLATAARTCGGAG